MKPYIVLIVAAWMLTGCADLYIQKSANYQQSVSTHQRIAILPFNFQSGYKKLPKNMTVEMVIERDKTISYLFQKRTYEYLQKHHNKKKQQVEILALSETDSLLKENGITFEMLPAYNLADLSKTLKVDGLITGNILVNKTFSGVGTVVAATASAVLLPATVLVSPNTTYIEVKVLDGSNGEQLWRFHVPAQKCFRSLNTEQEAIFKDFMAVPIKKLPYSAKKRN